ncbi:unnamed protein product [Paramecium octaurelia]|uniref:Uncharacterized protein n=1 Tax=Paramecium octaurelia TaxID=43137 RepID=A0A8S1THD4_PAROT|nr:unnamed protein product [Paramecium octaurelia]
MGRVESEFWKYICDASFTQENTKLDIMWNTKEMLKYVYMSTGGLICKDRRMANWCKQAISFMSITLPYSILFQFQLSDIYRKLQFFFSRKQGHFIMTNICNIQSIIYLYQW